MAQKKITDLTLRSDFDGTCNIPVDDTVQTWRVTGAQMLTWLKGITSSPFGIVNLSIQATVSSNALTIAVKTLAGGNPSSTDPVAISMRSSTATSGLYLNRTITGALSMTVSSGSTLGTNDGITSYLWVYAIDNAGTIELAVSSSRFDEGTLLNTTAEGGAGAADSVSAIYSTAARTGVAVRLIGRIKTSQTTAGTWAASPTEVSVVPFAKQNPGSLVLDTQNGYGSTLVLNTRWTNATYSNDGRNCFLYTQSSTNGDSITVLKTGLYSGFLATCGAPGTADGSGISKNVATHISSLTASAAVMLCRAYNTGSTVQAGSSFFELLQAGDVLRAPTHNGSAPQNNAWSGWRVSLIQEIA